MKHLDPILFAEAYNAWQAAPHGTRSYIVRQWADALNISYQALYSKFKAGGHMPYQRKTKCTKGVAKIDGLHNMAREIAHMYALIPVRAGRKPPLEYVVKKAIINGVLPESAAAISIGTFSRILREQKLLDREGRCLRFEAKKPMEQVQYDESGSEYLYVHRIENGEPILRVRASKGYKNKERLENLKVWYYGMIDDYSRVWLALPFVSPAPHSGDALRFFKWAFSKKDDPRLPFRGLPNRIYMDNGPLSKAEATKEFFKRISVELKTHEPNSSADTGKVEVKWKTLWSNFEVGEFLMDTHWEKREYKLSELRERLINYTFELNNKKHPNLPVTKIQAWLKVIQDGGVIDIDEAAFDTAFTRLKRHVGTDGIFTINKKPFFVKGLISADVFVYKGLLSDNLIVEDIISHQRYEAKPFEMPGLDEHKADKTPECVKVRTEAEEFKRKFAPGKFKGVYEQPADTNVVNIPVRTKEDREIEDPFDVTTYASLDDAMAEFMKVVLTLDPENKEVVRKLILQNGLKRQYVMDLALEVRAIKETERAAAVGM